jgi:hypothetical protein
VLKRSLGVLAVAVVIVACSSAGAPLAPSASNVWEQGRYVSTATAHPAVSESTVSEPDLDRERLLLPVFDALSEQPGFQVGGLHPDPKVNGSWSIGTANSDLELEPSLRRPIDAVSW